MFGFCFLHKSFQAKCFCSQGHYLLNVDEAAMFDCFLGKSFAAFRQKPFDNMADL